MELIIAVPAWAFGASASLLAGVTVFQIALSPTTPRAMTEDPAPRVAFAPSFSPAAA